MNQIKAEVESVQGTRHDSRVEETSPLDLAETYGEDGGTCQTGDDPRETDGIPKQALLLSPGMQRPAWASCWSLSYQFA